MVPDNGHFAQYQQQLLQQQHANMMMMMNQVSGRNQGQKPGGGAMVKHLIDGVRRVTPLQGGRKLNYHEPVLLYFVQNKMLILKKASKFRFW